MRWISSSLACILVAAIVEARPSTCTFHIQMTHALPAGTVNNVRVLAVGGTRIVKVIGYTWSVLPNYPLSATLTPPATGPENLSMITVEIDATHAAGAQQIEIRWEGGKPRRALCHRVLDVPCGKGTVPIDSSTITARRAVGSAVPGTLLNCDLVTAQIVEDGVIDPEEGECDPSFEVQSLGCNTYSFHNTTEYDVIGSPAQYHWTVALDDGVNDIPIPLANPNAENQVVTFPGPGTYIVELQSSGTPCGNETESAVEEIVVSDLSADFAVSHLPTQAYAVQLTNQSTNALGYSWDFNDNTPPATVPNPAHAFAGPGLYDICLTTTSTGGCQSQSCKLFKVSSDCQISFKFSYKGCPETAVANGFDVDFENTSAATGSGASYHWDFGDGSSTDWTGVTITHHYLTSGTYTVKLSDPNNTSCNTPEQTVTVHACTADFRIEECADGKVIVTTSSPSPTWDFTGGTPNTGTGSPAHTKYPDGLHPITMTSEDDAHCKCEVMQEVTTQDHRCRKNQRTAGLPPFTYDGKDYHARLKLTVHNIVLAHWVEVKMVLKKKNKWGVFRRAKADQLTAQWGGTVYRHDPDVNRCPCSIPENASDQRSESNKRKVRNITFMNGRFWSRKESIQATFFVKIDGNDSGRTFSPPLKLSKP